MPDTDPWTPERAAREPGRALAAMEGPIIPAENAGNRWQIVAAAYRAQRDALAKAVRKAVFAMRQPLDGWKGEVEAAALAACSAALALLTPPTAPQTPRAEKGK